MHLSSASSYTAIQFTLANGYLQDYTDMKSIYVQSGSPGLMYDGASDPSEYSNMVCSMNCDTAICCTNHATGATVFTPYCNGDGDDYFFFATATQITSDGCEALTLNVAFT